jgi:hypothetical protein
LILCITLLAYKPTVILLGGHLDPSHTGRTVDEEEEDEKHDREHVVQKDKQSYSGNTVYDPVDPRIVLTVNKPIVSKERRGNHQAAEQFDGNILR